MKSKIKAVNYFLLLLGIVIVLNFLSNRFFFRLDFTQDNRYTLSRATKDILKELQDPITVTAYFSEDLPPVVATTRRDFKDMLVEYASISDGMIAYEFINPNKDQESESKATQAGVQMVQINVRDKDQVKQQKAFLGAVVQMGDQKDVIPFVQPGAAMEYALSKSIKKVSVIEKPSVAFLQGHGEPSLRAMQQVMNELGVLYNIMPVTLNDTTRQLTGYKTLAIVAPTDTIPPSHLAQLDEFMANGGNVFVAINRVTGDFNTASGNLISTGLEDWLHNKGLSVDGNFVIDANCGSVSVRQQQDMFSFTSQIQFPYLPIVTNFSDHAITKGLETMLLQFASTIVYNGDKQNTFTPIIKTSEKSGMQTAPVFFDVQHQWVETDFPLANLTVAGVLTGKLVGSAETRIVVISDGDFAINGEGQQPMQQPEDNISFITNTIDWLSDDTGLIELRTKGVSARPIDQLDDTTKTFLKYLNFFLPLLVLLIIGLLRKYFENIKVRRIQDGII